MIPRVLTIAGSAAQGSAGIQADLKTFQEYNVYGMAVITAIVAKNNVTRESVFEQPLEAIEAQFHSVMEGVGADVVKTGMLFSKKVIDMTAELLQKAPPGNLVVDPVMIGKMGSQLLQDEAIETMKQKVFPLAKIITPNLHEAEKLCRGNEKLTSVAAIKSAAEELYELGPAYVLIKGGALKGPATDILYDGTEFTTLEAERIQTMSTSGAGCTYAAAIAAGIANGKTVQAATEEAKTFVTMAIRHSLSFDNGTGATYQGASRMFQQGS